MRVLFTGVIALTLLAGCAVLQPPRAPAEHQFCKPDSAVRYRGKVDPRMTVIRGARLHGSCRHQ